MEPSSGHLARDSQVKAMNDLSLAVVAACCAGIMVVFLKTGANRELRAALRTTMVVLVGWSFAWSVHPIRSWHALSKRAWVLLILSCLAIAGSWILYVRRARTLADDDRLTIDQLNAGFAILFAVTLFAGRPVSEFLPIALLIVAGAFILARKR